MWFLFLLLVLVAVGVAALLIADRRPRRVIRRVIEDESPRRVDLRDQPASADDEVEVVERRETRRRR